MENHQQKHNVLKDVENFFNTYLHQKVPFHLPPYMREWIVKYFPWIIMVVMLLTLPAALDALGLGGQGIAYHLSIFGQVTIYEIFALAALVLEAFALPGLFKRSLKGWHLVYYAVLIAAIGQLFVGEIVNAIFNILISMYFMFQIREYYK
jgi:hypothetical protein